MKTIISLIFFSIASITAYGQLCDGCNGTGICWSRKKTVKVYNDLILQRDGSYTYRDISYKTERTQSVCVHCGGTGVRVITKKKKPKPTYYSGPRVALPEPKPTSMTNLLFRDFYRIYSRIEIGNEKYYIVQHKNNHEKFTLVKATGELSYKKVVNYVDEISYIMGDNKEFLAFRVYEERAAYKTKYLKEDGSILYKTMTESYLMNPSGYLWVNLYSKTEPFYKSKKDKEGKTFPTFALYDGHTGKRLLSDKYHAPYKCECVDMWQEEGLLDAQKNISDPSSRYGYTRNIGIVNNKNEIIIPFEYYKVYRCLENGIIMLIDHNDLIRKFSKDGLEIEPPIEEVETCSDGNKIMRTQYQQYKYNKSARKMELKDKWIYEIFNPEMQPIPLNLMESCSCFNEKGWADIVPLNLGKKIYLHRDGTLSEFPNGFKYAKEGEKATLELKNHDRVQYFVPGDGIKSSIDVGDKTCETLVDMPEWARLESGITKVYSKKKKNGDCGCNYAPDAEPLFDKCSAIGVFEENGKKGYVLSKKYPIKTVIPAKYKQLLPVCGKETTLFAQDFKNRWGLISIDYSKGTYKAIFKCKYDAIYHTRYGNYILEKDGTYYIANRPNREGKYKAEPIKQLDELQQNIVDWYKRFPNMRGVEMSHFLLVVKPEERTQIKEIRLDKEKPEVVLENGKVIIVELN